MPAVDATTISRVNEAASRGVDFMPSQRKLSPVERKRLTARRSKRKPTLFRKCNEYAQLCDSRVWLVLQPHGSDQKEVFHSEPTSNFPLETWANIRDRGYPDPILHEPGNMPQVWDNDDSHDMDDSCDQEGLGDTAGQPRLVLEGAANTAQGPAGQQLRENMFDPVSGRALHDDGFALSGCGGGKTRLATAGNAHDASLRRRHAEPIGQQEQVEKRVTNGGCSVARGVLAEQMPPRPNTARLNSVAVANQGRSHFSGPEPRSTLEHFAVGHTSPPHVVAQGISPSTSSSHPGRRPARHSTIYPDGDTAQPGTTTSGLSRVHDEAAGQAQARLSPQDNSMARRGARKTVFQNMSGPAIHTSPLTCDSPKRSPPRTTSRGASQPPASLDISLRTRTPARKEQVSRAGRLPGVKRNLRYRGAKASRRREQI